MRSSAGPGAFRKRLASSLAVVLALSCLPVLASEVPAETRLFLKNYCYRCHGERLQKNDRRFDTLELELEDAGNLRSWQKILDVLHLGEMPPAGENVPRPSAEETRSVVGWLETDLRQAYARLRSTGGQTVYRRLNRLPIHAVMEHAIDPVEEFRDNNFCGLYARANSRLEADSVTSSRVLRLRIQLTRTRKGSFP